jgi:hypothetical protein
MRPILRASSMLALALSVVLAGSAVAWAKDFCVTSAGDTYAAKNFSLPKKGKCKPWAGQIIKFAAGGTVPDNTQTGTVCTASSGGHVDLTIVTTTKPFAVFPAPPPGFGRVYFEWMTLPLPSLLGGKTAFSALHTGFQDNFDATGGNCTSPVTIFKEGQPTKVY